MRQLVLLVVLAVFLVPARAGADAQVAEWIGDYAMDHDGHQGTLRIVDSKTACAGTPWCHLVVAYTGADGVRHPARILRLQQANQHMIVEIAFPGNRQRFDAYLFSLDKTRMAGTTMWGGRTFGFYAVKQSRVGQVRPPRPSDPSRPEAPRSAGGSGLAITANGEIAMPMPDGSTRLLRPGACGWTTVFPDGRRSTVSCNQVQPATPPLPEGVNAAWLEAHSTSLLDIARGLLGSNASSLDNYLNTTESGQPGVYDRIRLRTDLIAKLTAAM